MASCIVCFASRCFFDMECFSVHVDGDSDVDCCGLLLAMALTTPTVTLTIAMPMRVAT